MEDKKTNEIKIYDLEKRVEYIESWLSEFVKSNGGSVF